MNRFVTIGFASTLTLTSIAGAAFAAGMHGPAAGFGNQSHDADLTSPAEPTIGYGTALHFAAFTKTSTAQTDRAIRHWKGGRFDVVPVGNLDDTSLKASLQDRRDSEPRQVAALQTAIQHNHALSSRLKAQNVEIGNIIGAQAAIDGGMTFYVR
jgi:hypothetical protein